MDTLKKYSLLTGIIIMLSISMTMLLGSPYTEISEQGNDEEGRFYYIHRGVPISYTGTSVEDARLPSHLVKVPLTKFTAPDRSYVKILSIPQTVTVGTISLISIASLVFSLYYFGIIKDKLLYPLLMVSGIAILGSTYIFLSYVL